MLTGFLNAAKAIDPNLIAKRVLSRHKDELTALQKARLHKGEKTDGESLPLPYSTPYQKVRTKHGKTTSIKDLDLTGAHYSGMYSFVFDKFIEMGSKDLKAPFLEYNWGEDIYGLSEDDLNYVLWELGWAYEMAEEYGKELLK